MNWYWIDHKGQARPFEKYSHYDDAYPFDEILRDAIENAIAELNHAIVCVCKQFSGEYHGA